MKHVPNRFNRSPIYFLYNQYLKNHRKSRLTSPKNQQLLHFTTAKAREDQLPTLQDLLEVSRSVPAARLQTQQQSIQGLPVTAPGCKNIKPCRFKTSFLVVEKDNYLKHVLEAPVVTTCFWHSTIKFFLANQPLAVRLPGVWPHSQRRQRSNWFLNRFVCSGAPQILQNLQVLTAGKLIENSGFKLSRCSA